MTVSFDKNLVIVISLQSLSFVIRNTSPIGWVPILLCKAWELGFAKVIRNYLIGFVIIFMPIFGITTCLDSYYYGTLTIVPWNFIKVNVFLGLSQTFGSDPLLKYINQEIPLRFNILLPPLLFGILHHCRTSRNKQSLPYLVIYSASIVLFLSLISHKEPKFLLPVFPPFFLIIGQYLQDKWCKQYLKQVQFYVILALLVETVTSVYFVHVHELGAWGPINYLREHYPKYESLVVANKFEGNYLSLNHRQGELPKLLFVNHDPPFVQKVNFQIPLI